MGGNSVLLQHLFIVQAGNVILNRLRSLFLYRTYCLFKSVVFKLYSVELWGSMIGHQGFPKNIGEMVERARRWCVITAGLGCLALCLLTRTVEPEVGVLKQK